MPAGIWRTIRLGVLGVLSAGFVLPTFVQSANDLPKVGYMSVTTPAGGEYLVQEFLEGLRKNGYEEGRNIEIIWRYAKDDTDTLTEIATELVDAEVDVIFTPSIKGALAAQFETDTIPIVFAHVADPVGSGLVESMGRPGGNITGVSITSSELNSKRLELLKDAFHDIRHVGVIYQSLEIIESVLDDLEVSASRLGITIHGQSISNIEDLDSILDKMQQDGAEAVLVPLTPLFIQSRQQIVEAINTRRMPAIYELGVFVEDGGLMAYGPYYPESYRRAADLIAKILSGADPAELPVEQPLRFHLVVNESATKAIGRRIPPALLFRADRVIR